MPGKINLIYRIKYLYFRYFTSGVRFARFLGVRVGKHCMIATKLWPTEPYLITIGDHVQITDGVRIQTHGGSHVARERCPGFDCFGKVVINDWVYIGNNSQIMAGVEIGRGSLIAAGSIVTKSVPENSVCAGNPARFICTVDEYVEKNKEFDFQTHGLPAREKKRVLLSAAPDRFIKK